MAQKASRTGGTVKSDSLASVFDGSEVQNTMANGHLDVRRLEGFDRLEISLSTLVAGLRGELEELQCALPRPLGLVLSPLPPLHRALLHHSEVVSCPGVAILCCELQHKHTLNRVRLDAVRALNVLSRQLEF